jgi:hypothetical protein
MGSHGLRAGIAAAVLALGTGAWAVACGGGGETTMGTTSSTSAGGGSSSSSTAGTGGAAPISSFSPQGCAFTIAPRAEYQEFTASFPKVGATPNIRRVRLGLGGNVTGTTGRADPATSIGVAWQTDDGTLASEIAWGKDPDPKKWSASDRASGVTWLTPQSTINPSGDERMHEVYVCGLTPATTYYYRVGGGPAGAEAWSDVYSFSTTPAAGATKVTIGISGDSRGESANAWQILQRRMNTLGPTLQLFSGDMINLALDQGEWEQWLDKAWRDFDDKPLTLASQLILAAHGNHDNHTALYFGNLVLPQDNAKYPQYGELFYSVDVGPVHIVMIDDAWIGDTSGDPAYKAILQAWLDADLDAADKNRAKVPWVITDHHHHEYSASTHGSDGDVLKDRAFFAPIWQKYHVDLAVSGHSHNYERSKPLTGSDPDNPVATTPDQGVVYVVVAGAGAPAYPAGAQPFTEVSKEYSGSGIGVYAVLTADGTTLKLEAHELRADASDPVIDTFTKTK